jgi:hypothetical protein
MVHIEFISGIYMTTFVFSGIFFLKFWRASRDRFFLYFALACELIAMERVLLFWVSGYSPLPEASEPRTYAYVVRMVAFALILTAIIEKNSKARRG